MEYFISYIMCVVQCVNGYPSLERNFRSEYFNSIPQGIRRVSKLYSTHENPIIIGNKIEFLCSDPEGWVTKKSTGGAKF